MSFLSMKNVLIDERLEDNSLQMLTFCCLNAELGHAQACFYIVIY